ncbi:hypothetical protein BC834DRAFT_891843 [Gloeopeniophorella convolvens]|nr:hypothetical protein BC834DRAFT_891843 [Gloeopeniophorella convolvens]
MIHAGLRNGTLFSAAEVSAADDDPKAVHAIVAWFPPGKLLWSISDDGIVDDGFASLLDQLDPEYRNWLVNKFLPELRAFEDRVLGSQSARGAKYATLIATHPDRQQRGLATALIGPKSTVVPPVAALGTQNEQNATIARKLGYVELDQQDFDTLEWGTFTHTIFIRPGPSQGNAEA